jgi:hypothetical protein
MATVAGEDGGGAGSEGSAGGCEVKALFAFDPDAEIITQATAYHRIYLPQKALTQQASSHASSSQ